MSMTRILIAILVVAAVACKRPEEAPEFRRVGDIRVNKIDGTKATLNGNAYFYNPNDVNMTLRKINVDVFLEGKKIGTINESVKTKIPALAEFKVPVDASFDVTEVGVLKSILSVLGGKKMKAHYEGNIKLTVYGIPVKVPIDYEDEIRLR